MSDDKEMFGLPTEEKGPINFTSIHAMFAAAVRNGLQKPRFYAEDGVRLSLAPAKGKNPGAIYVKKNDDYMGKIVGNVFTPAAAIPSNLLSILRNIAESPLEYAITQGRTTGNCAICGRLLTNKVSVARGIGPICASRFGFDGFSAEEIAADDGEIETAAKVVTLATCRAFSVVSGNAVMDDCEAVLDFHNEKDFRVYLKHDGNQTSLQYCTSYEEALTEFKALCKRRRDFIIS